MCESNFSTVTAVCCLVWDQSYCSIGVNKRFYKILFLFKTENQFDATESVNDLSEVQEEVCIECHEEMLTLNSVMYNGKAIHAATRSTKQRKRVQPMNIKPFEHSLAKPRPAEHCACSNQDSSSGEMRWSCSKAVVSCGGGSYRVAEGSAGQKQPFPSGPVPVSTRGSPAYPSSPPRPLQRLANLSGIQEGGIHEDGCRSGKLGATEAHMWAMVWRAMYVRPASCSQVNTHSAGAQDTRSPNFRVIKSTHLC